MPMKEDKIKTLLQASKSAGSLTVGFLLVPNFSMLAFASALEPLRAANRMSGQNLFSWVISSPTGAAPEASNGVRVDVQGAPEMLQDCRLVFVCAGLEVKAHADKETLNLIRRLDRKGAIIGAICTGTYLMAAAGLLDDRRCTIHWENRDSFAEEFPEHHLTSAIYTVDGNRFTAAGGMASADLMLHLIGAEFGSELANSIADQMIHTSIRTEKDSQRLSIPTRIGVRHPKLSAVLELMESSLEEPQSPSKLATQVGVSTRQLERLFRRYLNKSPKRYYMELRLQKSRNLLLQTDMTVINVALACGFSSPSHFSKCYRNHFSNTPYRERGATDTKVK